VVTLRSLLWGNVALCGVKWWRFVALFEQGSAVADRPARRAASRWTCCKQIRWTLSVTNFRPN